MRLLHGGSWWSVPEGDEPLCLAGLCVPAWDADGMGRGADAMGGGARATGFSPPGPAPDGRRRPA